MENTKELIKELKVLITERHNLRGQIDCLDIDIYQIERQLGRINGLCESPRGY